MAEHTTRIAYLMNRLGVRAEAMSKHTGIDKTLISRWKSGQRKLSTASSHSLVVADFLLAQDNAADIISKTLHAYGLDEENGSLRENLAFWLAEHETLHLSLRNAPQQQPDSEYSANFRVFLGRKGLQSAIITVLDYMMSLPGKQELVVVIRGHYQWVGADMDYVRLLLSRLREAFRNDVTLTVINQDGFAPDNSAALAGPWLAAHLDGYINSCYVDAAATAYDDKLIAAVKDGLCLRFVYDENVEDGLYIAMYTDSVTVRQAHDICAAYQRLAKPHFRYQFLQKPGALLKAVKETALRQAPCHVAAATPCFGTVAGGDLPQYLRQSQKSLLPYVESLAPLFHTPQQLKPETDIYHIYCQPDIEALLQPGRHANRTFSAVFHKRVYYTPRQLLQQLQTLRDGLLLRENFQVALVSRRLFDRIPLGYYFARDCFSLAWRHDGENSACVREADKAASLYAFAELTWNSLPKYCKERRRSLKLLEQWIDILQERLSQA